MQYRKRPVVVEAWLASELLSAAGHEWKRLPTPKNAGEPYLVTFADSDKAGTYNADIGLELLNEYKCEIEIVYSINAKKNKIIEEFKHISGEALPFH